MACYCYAIYGHNFPCSDGGFLEGIADSIAGNLASSFAGNLISNLVSGNRKWGKNAQSRSDGGEEDNGENIESRVDVHVGEEEDVLSEAGLEENLDDDFTPSQKIDVTLSR